MKSSERQTKAAQREATTQLLVRVARDMFATRGYAASPAEEIVQQAALTRGALYHHFGGKDGLFRAVLEDVQRDVADRIEQAASGVTAPWDQLIVGCRAFLAASIDPQVQRIMLIDAPAVLGWEEWRRLDATYSMRHLRDAIETLIAHGVIAPLPVDALTHLLSGAMNEAALWISRAEHTEQALDEANRTLEHLLTSLRSEGIGGSNV